MLSAPSKLTADHDLTYFDCGDLSINQYLTKKALKNQTDDFGVTYVVADEDGIVVGYYTIAMASIYHFQALGNIKRNAPDPVPMLLMGRLGVSNTNKGQGIAMGMVKDFFVRGTRLANEVAMRGFVVHALNEDAARFWTKIGLKPSPIDELTMMISLNEVRRNWTVTQSKTPE